MRMWKAPSQVVAAVLLVGASSSGAQAQADCTCVLSAAAAGARVGAIGSVTGDVMMSMPAGYVPALSGNAIPSGARIVVGLKSQVALNFGTSCSLVAPAGSVVVIAPDPAGTCVAMQQPEPLNVADASSPGTAPVAGAAASGPFAATIFGLSLLGAGIMVAVDVGRDEAISR